MTIPLDRPPAAEAGSELLVLQKWEATAAWLLNHTARWPKSARFTLCQRVDNHALDIVELLVEARYVPGLRRRLLPEINLRLERMRFLFRLALPAVAGRHGRFCFQSREPFVHSAGMAMLERIAAMLVKLAKAQRGRAATNEIAKAALPAARPRVMSRKP